MSTTEMDSTYTNVGWTKSLYFFVFFEHNLTALCRAYLHFCLFDCAWSSICILQGLTSLRLSSHQVGLLLSSIWVQATIPGNTPTNFEAMAHTYKVALFFSRAKVSVSFPAALWMSFVHVWLTLACYFFFPLHFLFIFYLKNHPKHNIIFTKRSWCILVYCFFIFVTRLCYHHSTLVTIYACQLNVTVIYFMF